MQSGTKIVLHCFDKPENLWRNAHFCSSFCFCKQQSLIWSRLHCFINKLGKILWIRIRIRSSYFATLDVDTNYRSTLISLNICSHWGFRSKCAGFANIWWISQIQQNICRNQKSIIRNHDKSKYKKIFLETVANIVAVIQYILFFCNLSTRCLFFDTSDPKPLSLKGSLQTKKYRKAVRWCASLNRSLYWLIRFIWIGLWDFWVDWIDLIYLIDWLNGWIQYITCPKSYISYLI